MRSVIFWYQSSHQITASLYICKAVLSLLVGHKLQTWLTAIIPMWNLIRQWWDKHTWTSSKYGYLTISVNLQTLNIWAVVFWLSRVSVLVLFIPSSIESSCQEASRCSVFAKEIVVVFPAHVISKVQGNTRCQQQRKDVRGAHISP